VWWSTLRDIAYHAIQVRESLLNKHSRDPSLNEIAKALNLPREEVVFAMEAIQEPVSLFEPIYHDGGDPIYVMDQIDDEKDNDQNWLESIAISEALDKLTEREKKILNMRFFHGKTQMEVAEEIGISQAQVSRLEKAALNHMQKYI
jgi:RNA polymerase sporulation-specific sigma factor